MQPVTLTTPEENHVVLIRPRQPAKLEIELKKLWLKDSSINMKEIAKQRQEVMKAKIEGREPEIDTNAVSGADENKSALILAESEDLVLEVMVISVDDSSTNVINDLQYMTPTDYKAVLAKVNEITESTMLTDEQKKSSEETTPAP